MRASIALTALLLVGGCFAPDYRSGDLHCAAGGSCPPGLMCSPVDNRCYAPGQGPTPGHADMQMPADAGPPGGSDMADAGPGQPPTEPSSPRNVSASAGDRTATVTWSAPASDGRSPITGYRVTSGGLSKDTDAATLTASFSGLTNGTSYQFDVVAINAIGPSAAATSNAVTPTATPVAPAAPTDVTAAVSGPLAVLVTWKTADNGGTELTGYTVQSSDGMVSAPAGKQASSLVVKGLVAKQHYRFVVIATNKVSDSVPSVASPDVVAANVPGAPTGVSATAVAGQKANVQWTAPDDNGAAISTYTITANPDGATWTSAAPGKTVDGLTPGKSYTFTVTATNAAGISAPSPATSPILAGDFPGGSASVKATPDRPLGATVTWTAAADSGSPLVGYTVSWSGGSTGSQNVAKDALSAIVTGLTANAQYTFTVVPHNGFGDGAAASSAAVTILDAPSAPAKVQVCPAYQQVTVTFPAVPGASSYNVYYATSANVSKTNGLKLNTTATTTVVKNLDWNSTYYFVVTAVSAIGESAESSPAQQATPGADSHDTMFMVSGPAVQIYDCYSALTDPVQPTRSFSYTGQPDDRAGVVLANGNQLYTVRTSKPEVDKWFNSTLISGSDTPSVLTGDQTHLSKPGGVLYVGGRVYVSDLGDSTIKVFSDFFGLTTNTGPIATIGIHPCAQITIDESKDTLYCVVQDYKQVDVWEKASTLLGRVVATTRAIVVGSFQFSAIAIDTVNDYLYLGAPGSGQGDANVMYFFHASTLNGDVPFNSFNYRYNMPKGPAVSFFTQGANLFYGSGVDFAGLLHKGSLAPQRGNAIYYAP